jgi:hypothetical protein
VASAWSQFQNTPSRFIPTYRCGKVRSRCLVIFFSTPPPFYSSLFSWERRQYLTKEYLHIYSLSHTHTHTLTHTESNWSIQFDIFHAGCLQLPSLHRFSDNSIYISFRYVSIEPTWLCRVVSRYFFQHYFPMCKTCVFMTLWDFLLMCSLFTVHLVQD